MITHLLRTKKPSGIVRRLIVYTMLFSACITVVMTSIQLYLDYKRDIRLIYDSMEQIEYSYLDSIRHSLWTFDLAQVHLLLSGLLRLRDMQYVAITQDRGVLEAVGVRQSANIISRDFELIHTYRGQDILLGTLQVVASLNGVYRRLVEKVGVILISNGIKTFWIVLFVFMIFQRLVTRHLDHIAAYARQLAPDRFSQPLVLKRRINDKTSGDELDLVVTAINDMRANLQESYSALHESETRLDEMQRRLLDAIESLTEAFALYDADDRLVLSNSKYRELYDLSADLLVPGNRFEDHIRTSAYRGQIAEAIGREETWIADRLAQHHHPQGTFQQQLGDGRWLQISERRTHEGGIVGVRTDITDLKRREQDLHESENRFRNLIEGSVQGILIHRDNQSLFANQRYAEIFGYQTPDDIYSLDTLIALIAPHERDRLEQYRAARVANATVPPVQYECRGVHRDGSLLWLDMKVRMVTWKGQLAIQSTVFDITERKRAEEDIARHTQALEHAVQEKTREMEALMAQVVRQEKLAAIGQVSGSLAHELRNPLSVIKQSLFFLTRLQRHHTLDQANPKVSTHLQLMETEVDRANQSITQLLTMTQISSLQPEALDLRELLAEAVERVRWGAQMQLRLTCAPDPYVLWADRWSMQHVFMNLLSNAAEACNHRGTVTVSARVEAQTQQYQILVGDTGCGIPAAELEQVFEPLYTRKPWGTGLGLSLCQQLIAHHGGRITLQSRVGHGTTVHILMPVASRFMTGTTLAQERCDGPEARDTDRG